MLMSNNEGKVKKYLYGASVQGIQDFIFQTNKLKEIVGASEIVAEICTTAFGEILGKDTKDPDMIKKDPNWIVGAAGNIKYIFDAGDVFERTVLEFPRKIMTIAPGITISQAVVDLKDDFSDYAEKSNKLEQNLRTQRNKQTHSMTLGLMSIERAPRTGLPAIERDYKKGNKILMEGLIDEASKCKLDEYSSLKLAQKALYKDIYKDSIATEFDNIANNKGWLAVIHADGNGMGNIFQVIGKYPYLMKSFSDVVDKITKESARYAFSEVYKKQDEASGEEIPFRPIVLSGDDLTMICKADYAIKYTKAFLRVFEILSKAIISGESDVKEEKIILIIKSLKIDFECLKNKLDEIKKEDDRTTCTDILKKGLTACAGIAFVKASFPFHYATNLAEELCAAAKNHAKKGLAPGDLAMSCLLYHKVQDSFFGDYTDIKERVLMPLNGYNLTYEFGPYYLAEKSGQWTIDLLIENVQLLEDGSDGNSTKTNLREWLGLLSEKTGVGYANQKMSRLISILKERKSADLLNSLNLSSFENLNPEIVPKDKPIEFLRIPYYDLLSLISINEEEDN